MKIIKYVKRKRMKETFIVDDIKNKLTLLLYKTFLECQIFVKD